MLTTYIGCFDELNPGFNSLMNDALIHWQDDLRYITPQACVAACKEGKYYCNVFFCAGTAAFMVSKTLLPLYQVFYHSVLLNGSISHSGATLL